MLPISSADGSATGFIPSLFTATSASCVTGLVMVDTGTHWSFFGQVVVLVADPDRRPRLHDHRHALLQAGQAPHEHTRARRHGRLDKLERLRAHHRDNQHDRLGHAALRGRGRAAALHTLHPGARLLGRALVRRSSTPSRPSATRASTSSAITPPSPPTPTTGSSAAPSWRLSR